MWWYGANLALSVKSDDYPVSRFSFVVFNSDYLKNFFNCILVLNRKLVYRVESILLESYTIASTILNSLFSVHMLLSCGTATIELCRGVHLSENFSCQSTLKLVLIELIIEPHTLSRLVLKDTVRK